MSAQEQTPEPLSDDFKQALQRAEKGDRTALPEVQAYLDKHPEIWQEAGDLGLRAERAWITLAVGANLIWQESIERQLTELRKEFQATSPLEKLLVQRILVTWIQAHHSDVVYAQQVARQAEPQKAEFVQRRQESAQRRHLQAIKALATVKKLLAPPAKPAPAPKGKCKTAKTSALPAALRDRLQCTVGAN